MNLVDIKSFWKCCVGVVVLGAAILCMPGVAGSGEKVLKVNPRDVTDIQYMPAEIAAMMKDLGYDWMPVHDHAVGHGLEVAQQNGQYRMKFQATDDAAVTIDVHIRISDNVTGFYFHDPGNNSPDASPQSHYARLKERLVLEFGADSLSEGHAFFTP